MKRRWAFRICVFLLVLGGGAIVNVAVALRFADTPSEMRYQASWEVESFPLYEPDDSYRPTPGGFVGGNPTRIRQRGHRECTYWSKGLCLVQVLEPDSPERQSKSEDDLVYSRFEAGWPLPALGTPWVSRYLVLDEVVDDRGIQWRLVKRLRVPVWPGFAINTVFYAALLWMLFAMPFELRALRRWQRIKRGLCPKCAYDPRGSRGTPHGGACPECGGLAPSSTQGTG